MRSKFAILLLSGALAACQYTPKDLADRGVEAVHEPVVTQTQYVFDAAAPDGVLSPAEQGRLEGWFAGLGLGYGDTVYVDSGYNAAGRADVARIAGKYGILVADGAPVTAGTVAPGGVRVVVSRAQAGVAGCPDWSTPAAPNYNNRMLPNFGCSVNGNMAMQVANPQDLINGRGGSAAVDATTGAKAIQLYRSWELTGVREGQSRRPFKTDESLTRKRDAN